MAPGDLCCVSVSGAESLPCEYCGQCGPPAAARLRKAARLWACAPGGHRRDRAHSAAPGAESVGAGARPRCRQREAQEYNARRNDQLKGTFHIAYPIEDIEYQKKLSKQSGADIYDISVKGFNGYEETGCAVIERISSEKVLIKELLISEEFLHLVIKEIVKRITAKEYILRIPAYLGENLGGSVRPIGMIKDHRHCGPEIKVEDQGYLGIAFD